MQRVLSARSEAHARASTVFAGYLKLTPVLVMVPPRITPPYPEPGHPTPTPNSDQVLPGIIARRFYPAELQPSPEPSP